MVQNASPEIENKLLAALNDGDAATLGDLLSKSKFSNRIRAIAWVKACSEKGDLDCIKVLLPYINPKRENSTALHLCARRGNIEATRFLLPLCEPLVNRSQALRGAAEFGHLSVVHELLPLSPLDDQVLAFSDTVKRWNSRLEIFSVPAEKVLLHLMDYISVPRLADWHLSHSRGSSGLQHYDMFFSDLLKRGLLGMKDLAPFFQNVEQAAMLPSLRIRWEAYCLDNATAPALTLAQSRRL